MARNSDQHFDTCVVYLGSTYWNMELKKKSIQNIVNRSHQYFNKSISMFRIA